MLILSDSQSTNSELTVWTQDVEGDIMLSVTGDENYLYLSQDQIEELISFLENCIS